MEIIKKPKTETGKYLSRAIPSKCQNIEELIQLNLMELCSNTISDDFGLELYALRVINRAQKGVFESKSNDLERNSFLYDIICQKNCTNKCIVALEDSNNGHILDKLLAHLEKYDSVTETPLIPSDERQSNPFITSEKDQRPYPKNGICFKMKSLSGLSYNNGNFQEHYQNRHPYLGTAPVALNENKNKIGITAAPEKYFTETGKYLSQAIRKNCWDMEKLIRPNYKNICATTSSNEFAIALYSLNCISFSEKQECESKSDNWRRNEFLYDIIIRRNSSTELILALQQSDNCHILQKLRDHLDLDMCFSSDVKTRKLLDLTEPEMDVTQKSQKPKFWSILPRTASGKHLNHLIQKKGQVLEHFIRPIITELYNETQPNQLAIALYELEVISLVQYDEIIFGRTNWVRNERLYDIITKLNCSSNFIVALENSGNQHIIKTLINNISGIHDASDHFESGHKAQFLDFEETPKRNCYVTHTSKIRRISLLISILTLISGSILLYYAWVTESQNEHGTEETQTNKNSPNFVMVKVTTSPDNLYSVDYAEPNIVRLQLESVHAALPTDLLLKSKQLPINLTVTTTIMFDWSQWLLSDPGQIEALTLRGSFTEADIHYFLQIMKNLKHLTISHTNSSRLCDALTNPERDIASLARETVHESLERLSISKKSESDSDCDLLYSFLATQIHFPILMHTLFENMFVTSNNFAMLDLFFTKHKYSLITMTLTNVRLCEGCELFGDEKLSFPYLAKASLNFDSSYTHSSAAGKTIVNLSRASRILTEYSSNVGCDVVSVDVLKSNWWHLRNKSNLCQNKSL